MITEKFWKNKRVFVTGHTGFKGSWMSLWLAKLGAQVTGYALTPPTKPNLFGECRVGEKITSLVADVRDRAGILAAVRKAQPEIVIHLAAQPLVRESYKNPVETYETNVMGTVNLLDAVRLTPGIKAVVNVTTDKCYENREWVWGYRENEPMGGYDPYSNSKGCSELVTAAYRSSFFNQSSYADHGVALASARAGNVIGGGDWADDRLIPDCMKALINKQKILIRNPVSIRPWQHVLEPLCGYLMLAERLYEKGPAFAEAWNFGPSDDDAKPVQWIVEALCRKWGAGAGFTLDSSAHAQPHEARYLKLDCSKANTILGWKPRWSLDVALDKIVEWNRAFAAKSDLAAMCSGQIEEYVQ